MTLRTRILYALVCILGGVLAGQLAACDDGADFRVDQTFTEPHPDTSSLSIPVAGSVINFAMKQCSSGQREGVDGWVQINRSDNGYDGDLRCMVMSPSTSIPDLYHYPYSVYRWVYRDRTPLFDNIGNVHWYVPLSKCMRVQVWSESNYWGETDSRMFCNHPGNGGGWSVGMWELNRRLGGVSSIKTRICDYDGYLAPSCEFEY